MAIFEEVYRYDVEDVDTGYGVCTGHVDSGSIATDQGRKEVSIVGSWNLPILVSLTRRCVSESTL